VGEEAGDVRRIVVDGPSDFGQVDRERLRGALGDERARIVGWRSGRAHGGRADAQRPNVAQRHIERGRFGDAGHHRRLLQPAIAPSQ
jgi:hypothetical protein